VCKCEKYGFPLDAAPSDKCPLCGKCLDNPNTIIVPVFPIADQVIASIEIMQSLVLSEVHSGSSFYIITLIKIGRVF
jgi:hypothetical protein